MNQNDLAALIVKVAGMVLVASVLLKTPDYISSYFSSIYPAAEKASFIWLLTICILPVLITLIAGIVMWRFPYSIAGKYLPQEQIKTEITTEQWEKPITRIAIIVLGLYMLFWAISDLFYHSFQFYYAWSMSEGQLTLLAMDWSLMLATTAELVFAIWLLIGTNGIINWVDKARGRKALKQP